MRRAAILVGGVVLGVTLAGIAAQAADADKPDWAYAAERFVPAPASNDQTLHSIIGSRFQFTTNHANGVTDDGKRSRVQPADWFPEEHPDMPAIVKLGDPSPARTIMACSLCHMPEGRGRSADAAVAGLSADNMVQQMHDMKNGLRKSSDPLKHNADLMVAYTKIMTEDEIQASAKYYSAIPWVKWVNVVETDTIPKVAISNNMWKPVTGPGAGTEPLGKRIIEGPIDFEATEQKRDPHSGYIAYVPVGSIAAGQRLASTGGNGKTLACAGCHGVGLAGAGDIPGIAGRTASYLARQLYDIQSGARNGAGAQIMKPVVAKLTGEDIINLTAYVASLPPAAP